MQSSSDLIGYIMQLESLAGLLESYIQSSGSCQIPRTSPQPFPSTTSFPPLDSLLGM